MFGFNDFESDDRELRSFESELRQFLVRSADPLPLPPPLRASGKLKFAAVAVIVMLAIAALWILHSANPKHRHHIAVASQPLTEIQARVALAKGAALDDLAPIPVNRQQSHGVSALEVLSKE
jgi:hypothetical protein